MNNVLSQLIKTLLGNSPWTSILGYLILIATVVHQAILSGQTDWANILIGVLAALMGRKAADDKNVSE